MTMNDLHSDPEITRAFLEQKQKELTDKFRQQGCLLDSDIDEAMFSDEERHFDPTPVITPDDPVNHPSHYTQGKIECIDFITDKKLNFCRGNAVKYIVRAGLKDPSKEIEDLKKAVFYINREIQDLEKKQTEE